MLAGKRIVLGVTGGIAAYKAVDLCRRLVDAGAHVVPVMTAGAEHFLGRTTLSALASEPVQTSLWNEASPIPHTRLGQSADLIVVAPATARLLAAYAAGLSSDLLTNTLLATRAPVVVCPAMHTEMWEHPATRANVALLRERGNLVIEPAVGRLTGADSGKGRLPEAAAINAVLRDLLDSGRRELDLAGRRVVVSAGGTREFLDPVRFIGNRSSGLQGYALASAAAARGAEVVLIAANTSLPDPAGVDVRRVVTTADLRAAVLAEATLADAVVMAAAPADFRPTGSSDTKIKKSEDGSAPVIELTQNPDILKELAHERPRADAVIVGFAAETGDETGSVLELAQAKLRRKGCDLLVVNDVSGGAVFGSPDNTAVILATDAEPESVPLGSKAQLAHRIWDRVAARWQR